MRISPIRAAGYTSARADELKGSPKNVKKKHVWEDQMYPYTHPSQISSYFARLNINVKGLTLQEYFLELSINKLGS